MLNISSPEIGRSVVFTRGTPRGGTESGQPNTLLLNPQRTAAARVLCHPLVGVRLINACQAPCMAFET